MRHRGLSIRHHQPHVCLFTLDSAILRILMQVKLSFGSYCTLKLRDDAVAHAMASSCYRLQHTASFTAPAARTWWKLHDHSEIRDETDLDWLSLTVEYFLAISGVRLVWREECPHIFPERCELIRVSWEF
ncbi:hypothetical protein MPH_04450 [Macrophomina phaseolina MS6]|uniref:Uncharacterized protein n=1 Tax=Macrophomina phaseolina (strain MS6) TaxID=1126212 RepID=K2RU43_MACPH|nr:hypothetical protein MPH_04450 [Macrophomina phaseolina MS6]